MLLAFNPLQMVKWEPSDLLGKLLQMQLRTFLNTFGLSHRCKHIDYTYLSRDYWRNKPNKLNTTKKVRLNLFIDNAIEIPHTITWNALSSDWRVK